MTKKRERGREYEKVRIKGKGESGIKGERKRIKKGERGGEGKKERYYSFDRSFILYLQSKLDIRTLDMRISLFIRMNLPADRNQIFTQNHFMKA